MTCLHSSPYHIDRDMESQTVPPLYLPAGAFDSKQSSVEPESLSDTYFLSDAHLPLFESFTPLAIPYDAGIEGAEGDQAEAEEISTLRADLEQMKLCCARYEAQNQELRREIHLSTTDLLLLDKAKRDLSAENQALKLQLAYSKTQIEAIRVLFQRLQLEETEDVTSQCESLFHDFEDLSGRLSRLKVMHDHVVQENRRLNEKVNRAESSEKRAEELQLALQQKEKLISVLEDQMAVLRSTASRASSGRNSSEAYKRGEYKAKSVRKPKETGELSVYLHEDSTPESDNKRGSSGSTHEECSRPPLSISPMPRPQAKAKLVATAVRKEPAVRRSLGQPRT